MNSAIANGEDFHQQNTSVVHEDDITKVYLHGNLIAELGDFFVRIFDGGYQSQLTKSRLNAILKANGCDFDSVFQKNHQWFISDNQNVIPFTNGYTFS